MSSPRSMLHQTYVHRRWRSGALEPHCGCWSWPCIAAGAGWAKCSSLACLLAPVQSSWSRTSAWKFAARHSAMGLGVVFKTKISLDWGSGSSVARILFADAAGRRPQIIRTWLAPRWLRPLRPVGLNGMDDIVLSIARNFQKAVLLYTRPSSFW